MDKSSRAILFFLLKLFLIWFSWKVFVFAVGEESAPIEEVLLPGVNRVWENFNDRYKVWLIGTSVSVINMFGYEAEIVALNHYRVNMSSGVMVGNYCLGFQLMYYFIMLIAIAELRIVSKISAMVAGVAITTALNILRLIVIGIMNYSHPHLTYLLHDYVFNIIVFGTLMVFYYILVRDKK